MSYSCTDFTDAILNQLVAIKAIRAGDVPADDPQERQAGLAVSSIVTLHRAAQASRFVKELLASVKTLGGIAEEHGVDGLAFRFYLQAAILNGSFVEAHKAEAGPVELVKTLPSAGDWMKHIQFVARHA